MIYYKLKFLLDGSRKEAQELSNLFTLDLVEVGEDTLHLKGNALEVGYFLIKLGTNNIKAILENLEEKDFKILKRYEQKEVEILKTGQVDVAYNKSK